MGSKSKSEAKDQALAFLCSLTTDYGLNPSLSTAEWYARRERSAINPHRIMEALNLDSWEAVIKFYKKYIGGGY